MLTVGRSMRNGASASSTRGPTRIVWELSEVVAECGCGYGGVLSGAIAVVCEMLFRAIAYI